MRARRWDCQCLSARLQPRNLASPAISARTHADLLASERYHDAARFFLEDLYGTKDFSACDARVRRSA